MTRLHHLPMHAILLVTCMGCAKRQPPPALELPTADQITEMRASVTHSEFSNGPPVPEFIVPTEQIPKILFWLAPAEYPGDRESQFLAEAAEKGAYFKVAEIVIVTKSGAELRLHCHDWGVNPVAFTPNGKDFFLGHLGDEKGWVPDQGGFDGGAQLWRAIMEAHKTTRRKL